MSTDILTHKLQEDLCQQVAAPEHRFRILDWGLLDWGLLPLFVILIPVIYVFRAQYNLPLAANVDERTALEIFHRFEAGSLNPHCFLYPTLYYYLTYFLLKPFPPDLLIEWGRVLNLNFVGLTSFLGYSLCRRYFRSRAAGILSAFFIASSTTIVNSGSYICTDALLAAMTLATLLLLLRYFENPTRRNWAIAMIALGLALGCKYTAFLLFIAYAGTEMIREWVEENHGVDRDSESLVSQNVFSTAILILGTFFLAAAWAFPQTHLMRFATSHHTNPDLKSSTDYLVFFHHVRLELVYGGIALLASALLVKRSNVLYRLFSLKRIYLGLLIVLLVALVTTPYSVLDPAKFVYDLGAQARGTVMIQNGHPQWRNYFFWLWRDESRILLALGLLGFTTITLRNYRRYLVIILFTLLYVFTIGSAHIGFPRYLTPILPLVYVLAAGFLMQIWTTEKPAVAQYARILAVILVVFSAAELWAKFEASRMLSRRTDEFWSSYWLAKNMHVAKVLYAGYAPSAELNATGISTSQTSWASLEAGPLGNQLECGELLILERRSAEAHHLSPGDDPSVTILLDDRSGHYGQEVLRKTDCK
jgi:Dolichyl-phosphate-mannose-protein mannosyltransferase